MLVMQVEALYKEIDATPGVSDAKKAEFAKRFMRDFHEKFNPSDKKVFCAFWKWL